MHIAHLIAVRDTELVKKQVSCKVLIIRLVSICIAGVFSLLTDRNLYWGPQLAPLMYRPVAIAIHLGPDYYHPMVRLFLCSMELEAKKRRRNQKPQEAH